jgi:hypothetical protein
VSDNFYEFLAEAEAEAEDEDDRLLQIATRLLNQLWSPETSDRWFGLTKRERTRMLYLYRSIMLTRT